MKPNTGQHSLDPSYDQPGHAGVDPFYQKLISTTPKAKSSGCSKLYSKLKNGCDSLKPLLKRVGILLAFHVLNALIGVGGVVYVALVLTTTIFWFVFVITGGPITTALCFLIEYDFKCLKYPVLFTAEALCFCVLVLDYRSLFLPVAIYGIYKGEVTFAALVDRMTIRMICADVGLANFVIPAMPLALTAKDKIQALEVCTTDGRDGLFECYMLYYFRKPCQSWTTVAYFAVVKVVIGVLSATVFVLAVIQPLLVLFSGGSDPFVGEWMTFDDKPWGYVGIVFSLWVVGAFGLIVVAALSVKLTSCVCGTKSGLSEFTF